MCIPLKRLDSSGLNPPPHPSKTQISIPPPDTDDSQTPLGWQGREGDFETPNIDRCQNVSKIKHSHCHCWV